MRKPPKPAYLIARDRWLNGEPFMTAIDHLVERDRQILGVYSRRGNAGTSSDECERVLGLLHQQVAPRITDMKQAGLLVPKGVMRKTAQRCLADVLVIVPR